MPTVCASTKQSSALNEKLGDEGEAGPGTGQWRRDSLA
jgi:hypothetical protein